MLSNFLVAFLQDNECGSSSEHSDNSSDDSAFAFLYDISDETVELLLSTSLWKCIDLQLIHLHTDVDMG